MTPDEPPVVDPPDPGIPDVLTKLDQVLGKLDTILGTIDAPEDEGQEIGL